jgi:hypothetical protein
MAAPPSQARGAAAAHSTQTRCAASRDGKAPQAFDDERLIASARLKSIVHSVGVRSGLERCGIRKRRCRTAAGHAGAFFTTALLRPQQLAQVAHREAIPFRSGEQGVGLFRRQSGDRGMVGEAQKVTTS